jgi:DNA polymerase
MLTQLDQVRLENSNCEQCEIRQNCKSVVLGRGNINARFFVLGDQPNKADDKWGRPFMGRPGVVLDKILEASGLSRDKIYMSYLIKCHGRYTKGFENNCKHWLWKELKLIKPNVILCFGARSTELLTDTKLSVARPIIRHFTEFSTTVVPMYSLDKISKSGLITNYQKLIKEYV